MRKRITSLYVRPLSASELGRIGRPEAGPTEPLHLAPVGACKVGVGAMDVGSTAWSQRTERHIRSGSGRGAGEQNIRWVFQPISEQRRREVLAHILAGKQMRA